MRHQVARAGVCVIRLERQRSGILVSVLLSKDVSQRSTERELRFDDADEALQAVRDFVQAFLRETSRGS